MHTDASLIVLYLLQQTYYTTYFLDLVIRMKSIVFRDPFVDRSHVPCQNIDNLIELGFS